MAGADHIRPQMYTLVIEDHKVTIYRLCTLPDDPGEPESTVVPSGLVWVARTPRGDFLSDNLRGGVAQALDLFRDRDRGPGDPAEIEWQWEQMVRNGTTPQLPYDPPPEEEQHP